MTARDKLHQAVDELSELEAERTLAYIASDEPTIERQLAEQGKTRPTDLSGIEPLFASEDERREFLALIGR